MFYLFVLGVIVAVEGSTPDCHGQPGSYGCYGDKNAVFKQCPNPCQPTCENPKGVEICYMMCEKSGCECKPGFVRSDRGCVRLEDCPDYLRCHGDRNATFKKCPNPCPKTCLVPDNSRPCASMCLKEGCECKKGFYLNDDGKCVHLQDCPDYLRCNGDRNATFKDCPNPCPKSCSSPNNSGPCTRMCIKQGCECKKGFYLNDDGQCVRLQDCPDYLRCNGDRNATFKDCPNPCPKTCWSPDNSGPCARMCLKQGCECKDGFYLNDNGECVRLQDCPDYLRCHGDRNATYKECPNPCPKTCQSPDGTKPCTRLCIKNGCECKDGFYLNDKNQCVRLDDCPDYLRCNGDRNATFKVCPNPCPKTCSSPDNSRPCARMCLSQGCQCKDGFYLDDKNQCVRLNDCPDYLRCNGDRNATYKDCPDPCPKTCHFPGGVGACAAMCAKEGCQCKEGYYRDENGKCVQLQDCSAAGRCSANETFVYCNVGCPMNDCPVDDSLDLVACDPPYPCASGCSCKGGYLRLTSGDDRCILASECPAVECTRPNEVWDPSPSTCLYEKCSDIGKSQECFGPYFSRPKCVCRKGFYRNDDNICVPKEDCCKTGLM